MTTNPKTSHWRRLLPAFAIAAVCVAFSMATRIALTWSAHASLSIGDWLSIFGFGMLFDLTAALYLVSPLGLWLALAPNRLAATRVHRAAVVLGAFVYAYLFVLIAAAEWLFWDEFASRFNFIAVDYLLYTHEV